MNTDRTVIRLLLVDDEAEFRSATSRVLRRRGFDVIEAEGGEAALALVGESPPDVVVLDLKMDGMDGITTLEHLRKQQPELPVIILTGHGSYEDAVAGICLEIVDFLQKPVDVERLASQIRRLLSRSKPQPLREPTVAELMVPVSSYARVYDDEPIGVAVQSMQESFSHRVSGRVAEQGHRTILVFDRQDRFRGIVRIEDVVRLAVPPFLRDSPYASFFTGMFLAQCKTLQHHRVADVLRNGPHVSENTPLMEAAHLMTSSALINLPVMREERLVGILRDKDLLLEIARHVVDAPEMSAE